MALNIKNEAVERLAAEVARLTGESKTEAIRRALDERKRRLKSGPARDRRARVLKFLKTRVWPKSTEIAAGPAAHARRGRRDSRVRPGRRMTLDTSALIAILFAEPGYLDLVDRILEADHVRVGTPTLVEAGMVLAGRRRAPAGTDVGDLVEELGVTVAPFTEAEWQLAVSAFVEFGRGRHPARLNFGDCLAYASARHAGDTLLFVGDDFRKTDIPAA